MPSDESPRLPVGKKIIGITFGSYDLCHAGHILMFQEVRTCRYVDETIVYQTEAELEEILKAVIWDVRILGDEYKDVPFTGRDFCLDKCYFNRRPHKFSSSSLRNRVVEHQPPPEPIVIPRTTPE